MRGCWCIAGMCHPHELLVSHHDHPYPWGLLQPVLSLVFGLLTCCLLLLPAVCVCCWVLQAAKRAASSQSLMDEIKASKAASLRDLQH